MVERPRTGWRDKLMAVEQQWSRIKLIAANKSRSPSDVERLQQLVVELLNTAEGRKRFEAGLKETFEGKSRVIKELALVLDRSPDPIASLSAQDRLRLLQRGTDAGQPFWIKEEAYWNLLWHRIRAGDETARGVVADVMKKLTKNDKKGVGLAHQLTEMHSWGHLVDQRRIDLLDSALGAATDAALRELLQRAVDIQKRRSKPPPAPLSGGNPPPSRLTAENSSSRPVPPPAVPAETSSNGSPAQDTSPPPDAVPAPSTAAAVAKPAASTALATAEEPTAAAHLPPAEPAVDGAPPQHRKRPRPAPRPAETESPIDFNELADAAQRIGRYFHQNLQRFDGQLSALAQEVQGVRERLATMEDDGKAAAALREEVRWLSEQSRGSEARLEQILDECAGLRDRLAEATDQIETAQARAAAAEARADQHIDQANQDRENAVQNHLATLRPTLQRLLIDVRDPSPEDGDQSETEQLLWEKLREIKTVLRAQGVLLD